jgi:hypothetical protein
MRLCGNWMLINLKGNRMRQCRWPKPFPARLSMSVLIWVMRFTLVSVSRKDTRFTSTVRRPKPYTLTWEIQPTIGSA